jgi:hypothetical protein
VPVGFANLREEGTQIMAFLFPGSDDQPARLQFEINLGPVMKMGFGS